LWNPLEERSVVTNRARRIRTGVLIVGTLLVAGGVWLLTGTRPEIGGGHEGGLPSELTPTAGAERQADAAEILPATPAAQDGPGTQANAAYVLEVLVLDGRGSPQPGASVTVLADGIRETAVTTVAGTCEFGFREPVRVSVHASLSEHRAELREIPVAGNLPVQVRLQFPALVRVRIRVTDHEDTPLAQVLVVVAGRFQSVPPPETTFWPSSESGITDATGIATFLWVPHALLEVRAFRQGYHVRPEGRRTTSDPDQEIHIVMDPGELVTVTAVDAATGVPVPDLWFAVWVYPSRAESRTAGVDGVYVGFRVTNEDGQFQFSRGLGETTNLYTKYSVTRHAAATIPVGTTDYVVQVPSGSMAKVRLVLPPGAPTRESCRIEYQALGRSRVQAEEAAIEPWMIVQVRYQGQDSSPRFRITLDGIGCSAWFRFRYEQEVPITRDLPILPWRKIKATVVEKGTGNPIPGVHAAVAELEMANSLSLAPGLSRVHSACLSDAGGRIELEGMHGRMLELRLESGIPYGSYSRTIGAGVGDLDLGRIELDATGILAIQLVLDGVPARYCHAILFDPDIDRPGGRTWRRRFCTDHEGWAVLEGVPPGVFSFVASGPGVEAPVHMPGINPDILQSVRSEAGRRSEYRIELRNSIRLSLPR
jgi:hypothetical protein